MKVYVVTALTGSYDESDNIIVRDVVGIYSNLALAARAAIQTFFVFGEAYYRLKHFTKWDEVSKSCLFFGDDLYKEYYKNVHIQEKQLNE